MISAVILTKDNEETIKTTLASLAKIKEVILVDTGSSDKTLDIAKSFPNVRMFSHPFCGFGALRNFGASMASNDWILAIDSDEVLSPLLSLELEKLSLDPHFCYSIPFENFYNGKLIKWCGWYPEAHIRLYNKNKTSFDNAFLHEGVIPLSLKKLKHPIYHYSYRSIEDFIQKMQLYSTLFAEQYKGKKNSSFMKALFHSWGAFLKSYIWKRGFLGGKVGFIISLHIANTTLYKYLKLEEKNKCS